MYKIKQLEWEQPCGDVWRSEIPEIGDTFYVRMHVKTDHDSFQNTYTASDRDGWICLVGTLERAKEVCQQQFESRIKRFLEPV
jgi:hypothetical protein